MGLLDDAIREHLELKRRRGADPGEVAREEHEALTPPVTTRGAWAAAAESQDEGGASNAAPGEGQAAGEPEVSADAESERDAFAGAEVFGGVDAPASGVEGAGTTQETVEIDMESMLADDGTVGLDSPDEASAAGPLSAGEASAAREEELFEWEMHAGRMDEVAADEGIGEPQVPEQIPGQERMSFE